jgi:hypothetical protein
MVSVRVAAKSWTSNTPPFTAERRRVYSAIRLRKSRFLFMAKINTSKTAEQYSVSKRWLEKARLHGFGPPFLKIGRKIVLYDTDTLDRWFAACERNSTSEVPPLPPVKPLPPAPPASKPVRRRAKTNKVQSAVRA